MKSEVIASILTKVFNRKFYGCESSNVICYGWEDMDTEQQLGKVSILFKCNKLYVYNGIPRDKFEELLVAQSKGKWVNENLVKSTYSYRRFDVSYILNR